LFCKIANVSKKVIKKTNKPPAKNKIIIIIQEGCFHFPQLKFFGMKIDKITQNKIKTCIK